MGMSWFGQESQRRNRCKCSFTKCHYVTKIMMLNTVSDFTSLIMHVCLIRHSDSLCSRVITSLITIMITVCQIIRPRARHQITVEWKCMGRLARSDHLVLKGKGLPVQYSGTCIAARDKVKACMLFVHVTCFSYTKHTVPVLYCMFDCMTLINIPEFSRLSILLALST